MLASPGGANASVGSILNLVSSSVFSPLVIIYIPLFLYLSFPLSLLFFLLFLLEVVLLVIGDSWVGSSWVLVTLSESMCIVYCLIVYWIVMKNKSSELTRLD